LTPFENLPYVPLQACGDGRARQPDPAISLLSPFVLEFKSIYYMPSSQKPSRFFANPFVILLLILPDN